MSTDAFTSDLSKLDKDYQVLTELHRTANSRTYLARHLELNRDVTITVFRAATGERVNGDRQSVSRFAGDVARLKTARHPNVIPVIEGRWLGDGVFAVARARVRGSTLDQLLSAVGPIPLTRIASTLTQVRSALDWARANGIANRDVAQDTMIFQQGSGRVLLSLEPSDSGSTIDPCEDARTLGRLAWEMLSGQRIEKMAASPLATLRPDLPPAIVAETEALVHCERSAPRDVGAYIALLGGTAATEAPVVAAKVAPTPIRYAVADMAPPYAEPLPSTKDAVVVAKTAWSFNARLTTAAVVGALAIVVALLFTRGRDRSPIDQTAANRSAPSAGEAAGDVVQRPDTSIMPATTPAPTPVPVASPVPVPVSVAPMSRDSAASETSMRSGFTPPETRRHEPLHTAPAVTLRPDSTQSADTATDICSSPNAPDQRLCLTTAIERNDAELNGVYQRLIAAIRRQANVTGDDADPDAVDQLRATQRRWLDDRDQTCHTVGSGALWARDRAQCFADQSAKRTRDLRQQLDTLP